MIITCPQCQTRYLIDAAVLGAAGRTVRCAKCNHTWAQRPEEDIGDAVAAARVAAGGEAPRLAAAKRDPERRGPRPKRAGGANLPAVRRRGEPWRARAAWALLIVVVALFIGGGAAMRDSVIDVWPAAEPLYDLLGMAAPPPGYGLDLRNVTSGEERDNGVNVLLVEGQIANPTKKVRAVPRLRGALFDKANQELQHWTFTAPEDRLSPGESVTFRTRLRNPVAGAVRLTIVFDQEDRN